MSSHNRYTSARHTEDALDTADEWHFDFVISRANDKPIRGVEMDLFFDEIIEYLEERDMYLGGGYRPIKEDKC